MDVLSRHRHWHGYGYVLLSDGRTSTAIERLTVIQAYAGMYRIKLAYESDFEKDVDYISLAYVGHGKYQGSETTHDVVVTGRSRHRRHLELILSELSTNTPPEAIVRVILKPSLH